MLVLDTDLLSIIQSKTGTAHQRLAARLEEASATQPIAVTIISFEEQTRGWLAVIARARSVTGQIRAYARLRAHFDDYRNRTILDFDDRAGPRFEKLVKAKLRIGTMDLRIAAIVLAHEATLLSRNLTDFRKVPALRVEDWTQS